MALAVSELLAKKETIPHKIGDLGGGGGGGDAVFWRFACDLVLLGPFLLTWPDRGASALVLVLADLPVC